LPFLPVPARLPSSFRPVGNLSEFGGSWGPGAGVSVCVSVLVELQQSVHRDIPLRIALFCAASSPRSLCPLYALINNYKISALFMAASAVYFWGQISTDFLFSSPLIPSVSVSVSVFQLQLPY